VDIRKQHIDFDECLICGREELYQKNDLEEGYFYDTYPVYCSNCGEVGYTIADEGIVSVVFNEDGIDELFII
jgi:hypothetical protein